MRILLIDGLLDGGSTFIKTDIGDYYIDNRLKTSTPDTIYFGYPDSDESRIVTDNEKHTLLSSLEAYITAINNYGIGGMFANIALEKIRKGLEETDTVANHKAIIEFMTLDHYKKRTGVNNIGVEWVLGVVDFKSNLLHLLDILDKIESLGLVHSVVEVSITSSTYDEKIDQRYTCEIKLTSSSGELLITKTGKIRIEAIYKAIIAFCKLYNKETKLHLK